MRVERERNRLQRKYGVALSNAELTYNRRAMRGNSFVALSSALETDSLSVLRGATSGIQNANHGHVIH